MEIRKQETAGKKNVHIISHSHWDREWYMPFEYHRAKLVELIDNCMELFENDEDFKSFHLDGHTALVEDYLEIKPQNREKIKKYIEEGKFFVGPWYILQDEFLTSAEANVRNLMVGMRIARDFGKVSRLGYFPDSFGNAGQMPQLLKQAGMKAIAFGRGVKPTGTNNTVSDGNNYRSQYSELYWQSPDGSTLPAILFANWYNNGWEIPVDANPEYWNNVLENVEKYASTTELLLMNGCDHQPVQRDLSQALQAASEKYPDYNFIHSDFETYVRKLVEVMPENLATVRGELIGQDTDGWTNLVNTASSHVDLKIMNKTCENLLENAAEPLSVIAAGMGKECPRDMLLYAWKTLMKNHPHDSICGCSCDEVNDEMRTRFIKCKQATETIIQDDLDYISQHIDVAGFEKCDAVFAVINTFAKERCGVVSVDVDVRRIYKPESIHKAYDEISTSIYQGAFELMDWEGNRIPCSVTNRKARFGYDLPDDRFRQPYVAETVTVTFEACDIPAMGYQVYGLKKMREEAISATANEVKTAEVEVKTAAEITKETTVETVVKNAAEISVNDMAETLVTDKNTMENQYMRVVVAADGTINVYDKENNRDFCGLMRFEDVADLGNEYTFVPAPDDIPVLSGETPAQIELVCDEEFMAEYRITTEMQLPVSADAALEQERASCVNFRERKSGRSKELVTVTITSYVSLEKNSRSVKIRTELNNTAKDHRLRVLFPTGMKCAQHKAESVFEASTRNNRHKPTWTYPSECEHQQGFVMMQDETSGLGIANLGLYEYEILEDNTIAVTLVRAVGELGDWGIFPTKLSQMQKQLSFAYEITPFGNEKHAWTELVAFQYSLQKVQITKSIDAAYKNNQFVWSGEGLKPCAFKPAQESADIIMRWANYSAQEQTLTIEKTDWIDNLYLSNVIEEKGDTVADGNGKWNIKVKPFEIITVGCSKN